MDNVDDADDEVMVVQARRKVPKPSPDQVYETYGKILRPFYRYVMAPERIGAEYTAEELDEIQDFPTWVTDENLKRAWKQLKEWYPNDDSRGTVCNAVAELILSIKRRQSNRLFAKWHEEATKLRASGGRRQGESKMPDGFVTYPQWVAIREEYRKLYQDFGNIHHYLLWFILCLYTMQPPLRLGWANIKIVNDEKKTRGSAHKETNFLVVPDLPNDFGTPPYQVQDKKGERGWIIKHKRIRSSSNTQHPVASAVNGRAAPDPNAPGTSAQGARQANKKNGNTANNSNFIVYSNNDYIKGKNENRMRLIINKDKVSETESHKYNKTIYILPELAEVIKESLEMFPRQYVVPFPTVVSVDFSKPMGESKMTIWLPSKLDKKKVIDSLRAAYATYVYNSPSVSYNLLKATAKAMRHSVETALQYYRKAIVGPEANKIFCPDTHGQGPPGPGPASPSGRDRKGKRPREDPNAPAPQGPSVEGASVAVFTGPVPSTHPHAEKIRLSTKGLHMPDNVWNRKKWWEKYSLEKKDAIRARKKRYYEANKKIIRQRTLLWELNNGSIKNPNKTTLKELKIKKRRGVWYGEALEPAPPAARA